MKATLPLCLGASLFLAGTAVAQEMGNPPSTGMPSSAEAGPATPGVSPAPSSGNPSSGSAISSTLPGTPGPPGVPDSAATDQTTAPGAATGATSPTAPVPPPVAPMPGATPSTPGTMGPAGAMGAGAMVEPLPGTYDTPQTYPPCRGSVRDQCVNPRASRRH